MLKEGSNALLRVDVKKTLDMAKQKSRDLAALEKQIEKLYSSIPKDDKFEEWAIEIEDFTYKCREIVEQYAVMIDNIQDAYDMMK